MEETFSEQAVLAFLSAHGVPIGGAAQPGCATVHPLRARQLRRFAPNLRQPRLAFYRRSFPRGGGGGTEGGRRRCRADFDQLAQDLIRGDEVRHEESTSASRLSYDPPCNPPYNKRT